MIIPKIHFRQPVIGKGYVEISNTNIFVMIRIVGTGLSVEMVMPKNKVLLVDYDRHLLCDVCPSKNKRISVLFMRLDGRLHRMYSLNRFVQSWLEDHNARLYTVSDAQWALPRNLWTIAYAEFEGDFNKEQRAEFLESAMRRDICDIPQHITKAYDTFVKELCDDYYARCFAMRLCELDLYDGQPVIYDDVIVWGQNPAQNV